MTRDCDREAITYLRQEADKMEAEAKRRTVHPDLTGEALEAFKLLGKEHQTFARAYRAAAQCLELGIHVKSGLAIGDRPVAVGGG
jgi:hypothetical protein